VEEEDFTKVSGYVQARGFRLAASTWRPIGARLDRAAGGVFILPAVVVILGFSIFPLIASLYVSLSRLRFSEGGVDLKFVGLDNYAKLVTGIDHNHFLGLAGPLTPVGLVVLAAGMGSLRSRCIATFAATIARRSASWEGFSPPGWPASCCGWLSARC